MNEFAFRYVICFFFTMCSVVALFMATNTAERIQNPLWGNAMIALVFALLAIAWRPA